MRNLRRGKIKRTDVELYALLFTLYEFSFVPHGFFISYKYIVLIALFCTNIRRLSKESVILVPAMSYGGILVISSIVNHMSVNSIVASVFFLIQLIDFFAIIHKHSEKNTLQETHNIIFLYTVFLLVMTDILVVFNHYDYSNPKEVYFIGNKFSVSYLHTFFLMLMAFRGKIDRKTINGFFSLAVSSIISIVICYVVQCSTGIVVNVALLILLLVPEKIARKLSNIKVIVAVTIGLNILIFGSVSLFSLPFVRNLMVSVLHETENLTGRLYVYKYVIGIINNKPIIGYGYYSSIVENYAAFITNAQNGVMKILIDCGILGLLAYSWMMYKSLFRKGRVDILFWPFIAFFYAMIIGSTVEITLTGTFVFLTFAVQYANNNALSGYGNKNEK